MNQEMNVIPQPRVRPLVGNVPEIDPETPVQSFMKLAKEFGPIYRLTFPTQSMVVVSGREYALDACDESRFEKAVHGPLKFIRDVSGDGLFTARNDEVNWGKAHRILMPAFGPAAMRNYFDDMLDVADQMFTRWERFGHEHVFDVADSMTRLTLDTIALCGFGYRFNSFYQNEMHPFVDSMLRVLEETGNRSRRLPIQTQLMFLANRQFDADRKFMYGLTDELIAKRRALPKDTAPRDLLSLMLQGRDPVTGESLDAQNIRYQLVTFLVAGHETTSGLLSFATHLLLKHPHVMERARNEVDAVLGSENPRYEDMSKLVYVDQILRETLRLYPTAPAFGVKAKKDTTLGTKYLLKQDDVVLVLLPSLHRDPSVWKNPEVFDPDRFAPGERAQIPDHAWMPFGHGMRACIGRAFAWQEATMVLAMMLQRFDIRTSKPYTLKIKEALTLKPDGLKIQARVRKSVVRTLSSRTPNAHEEAAKTQETTSTTSHGTPLLVLFGSNSGTAEAFARRIANDGSARGFRTTVSPLDAYAGRLPKTGGVVIVSASYNGQPPDNARAFCTWLQGVPAGELSGVKYSVFGCGNRDWESTYQRIPTLIDTQLHDAGGVAFLARGEADARGDFFGDFDNWYMNFWPAVRDALGVAEDGVDKRALYTVEVAPPSVNSLVEQNHLEFATVTEKRELVDMRSPLGRSKKHLELTLPAGTKYTAGDYLAVLPENHPELVARAARRFQLDQDSTVVLRSNRGAMAASLPTDKPISVHELLARHVELSSPATRRDLARLAASNPCPPHREHLSLLSRDTAAYKKDVLDKRVSVLEWLETYTACAITFAEFLEMLPAMRLRQYSIASSPRVDASRCALTVAVVEAPAWSGRGQFHGTASSYLSRLQSGDVLPVTVRTPKNAFHPPASNATPMVMIAAGTGIAPFRGFMQERALRRAAGEALGPTVLFFGCDHPDVDFLYRDEIEALQREGVLEVYPAYFRASQGDVTFVQHRVWQERARVNELIESGATVFVCGDGQHMAPAVRETLRAIRSEFRSVNEEQATGWLREMEQAGRYVEDVFA